MMEGSCPSERTFCFQRTTELVCRRIDVLEFLQARIWDCLLCENVLLDVQVRTSVKFLKRLIIVISCMLLCSKVALYFIRV
jgi:hypothetical protein